MKERENVVRIEEIENQRQSIGEAAASGTGLREKPLQQLCIRTGKRFQRPFRPAAGNF